MSNPRKIRVVKVSGTPYQRSFQHAQELGREALAGSMDFYRNFWDIQIAHMVPGMPKIIQRTLVSLINKLVVRPGTIDRRLPLRDRELLKGYSEGIDHAVSYEDLKRAAAAPDAYNYCLGWLFRTLGARLPAPPPIPGNGLGCSSLVAWGKATADGGMIFGRNLDFFTGDKWIDQAVVLVAEPGPGEIPFTSITSAGIPIEGITAFNAEGLTVSTHQNFSKSINTRGRSIISLTNEIAVCARSISDAIKIISSSQATSGWTIVIGSAAEGNAVIIETNAEGYEVISSEPDKPWLCYANNYLHPRMIEKEYIPGHGLLEHNHARLHRMNHLLEDSAGEITPETMAAMLGDHYDPISRMERPMGNIVSAVHNVTSAVIEPDKQRVWVAEGPAPANTTSAYVGFDIDALRRGEDGDLGTIPGNAFFHSSEYPALRQYTLAYQAFDDLNEDKVVDHLEKACQLHPEEPIYAFMLGLFYLKRGRTEAALELFYKADKPFNSSYRRALVWLWQGRCHDILGQRSQAMEIYRRVLDSAPQDSSPFAAAGKGLKKPYKSGAVKHVVAEFLMGDAQEI